MAEIIGKSGMGNIGDEAAKVQASLLKADYEHHTVTLVAPAANVNLTTLAPTAFATVIRAHTVIIRCDADITVRFNNAANHAIPVSAAEGGFTTNTLEINSIFVTAPIGATLKFYLV